MEIHAWSGDGHVCFIVHEHLLRPLSLDVRGYRRGNEEDRLKWQCDIDGHRIGAQTIRFFLHWLYHNSLGSANLASSRDINTEGIEDHQLRIKIQSMHEIFL